MLFLLSILVITVVIVMAAAISVANKEDIIDSFCLYGESVTTKGSNSD